MLVCCSLSNLLICTCACSLRCWCPRNHNYNPHTPLFTPHTNKYEVAYVYLTVHHLDNWLKRDQLDVTCFIISLFNAQHVSDVNTSILRSLRLICWVISWVVLFWFDVCCCYVVVWLWWCGIRMHAQQISRKLFRMDVLTSETCWALNNEIIKQVTSSLSLFTQLWSCLFCNFVHSPAIYPFYFSVIPHPSFPIHTDYVHFSCSEAQNCTSM